MPIPVPGRAAEHLRRASVQILTANPRHQGNGSGIVLPDDRVLTNAHVVQGDLISVQSWEGREYGATLLKTDARRDLAVLLVRGLNAPSASFGDSSRLHSGTPVFAVGNPLGFVGAVSSGVIHAVGPLAGLNGWRSNLEWIQADVRLAPGNSGGPLATLDGQVVGLNTMVTTGGLALAVPARAAEAFLTRLQYAPRLGVTVRPVSTRKGEFGLLVLEVSAGSAAELASLLPGDILQGANNVRFRWVDDLDDALLKAPAGLLTVEFYRGGSVALRHVAVQLQRKDFSHAA